MEKHVTFVIISAGLVASPDGKSLRRVSFKDVPRLKYFFQRVGT
jgi:hypothetical protein